MTYVGERRETERLVTDPDVRQAMHRVIRKPACWLLWLKHLDAAPAVQECVRQELARDRLEVRGGPALRDHS